MYKSKLIIVGIQCIQAVLVFSNLHTGRPTRGLSMLRMGKRTYSLPPLVPPSYDLPEDDLSERQLVGAPRMGKDIENYDFPRYGSVRASNPLPRLGVYEELINEIRRDLVSNSAGQYNPLHDSMPSQEDTSYLGRQKRSVDDNVQASEVAKSSKEKRALPRFGVLRELDEAERPLPRLGLFEREHPFPKLGLYEREASLPRFGVREAEEQSYPMGLLGEGDNENEVQAEGRALPRFGVLRDVNQEKRAMSMLRMGKRDEEEIPTEEKRKMSMLRMGKRKMSMLRMGKRGGMSMLRMGRSQPEEKRAMSMLRMGRSSPETGNTNEEQKRAMSMLRMGKRGSMSMLRMGRSQHSDLDSKRGMSMLRMGRGMSMLRMGRSGPVSADSQQKRSMSLLRMGRSAEEAADTAQKEEMKITENEVENKDMLS